MAKYFTFYHAQYNPTGLSGTVGGSITSTEVQPYLNSLFTEMPVSTTVPIVQYRKVWAKQTKAGTFTGVYIEIGNVEHTGQVFFDIVTGTNGNTSTGPLYPPPELGYSYSFSGNYNTSLLYTGNSTLNTTIPIWIKEKIDANIGDDDLASFSLRVRATKI